MVKQLLTWIACSLVLVACNDSSSSKVPEPEPRPVPGIETPKYLRSYVCYYMDGEWGGSGVRDCRLVLKDEGLKVYASADITGRPDEKAAEFQRLAERNGDVSYNRSEIPLSYNHRSSYVHNLRAIHAVCTSGDWDADHAKGESLDDCIQADFLSYGKYVDSGYTLQDNVEWVKKTFVGTERKGYEDDQSGLYRHYAELRSDACSRRVHAAGNVGNDRK